MEVNEENYLYQFGRAILDPALTNSVPYMNDTLCRRSSTVAVT